MMTEYPFQYDGQPATLKFSEVVGEVSELRFIYKGVDTLLSVEEFTFNEKDLRLTVTGKEWVFYNDGTLLKSPEKFSVDATSQESIDYFANIATPKMSSTVKRMQVNGVAIHYLGFPLFDATGAFNPQYPLPDEPAD